MTKTHGLTVKRSVILLRRPEGSTFLQPVSFNITTTRVFRKATRFFISLLVLYRSVVLYRKYVLPIKDFGHRSGTV